MTRFLYLHIGCGKTGSSALQVWLNQNTAHLQQAGILYPVFGDQIKDDYQITSGNGVHLINALKSGIALEFLQKLYTGDVTKVLLSSEAFQILSENEINELISAARAIDANVRVIAYVRNLYEMLYSSYMQLVKRHGFSGDLFSYGKSIKTLQQFEVVDAWSNFFGDIRVLHYDTEKKELGSSFLKAIDLPSDVLPIIKKNKVNRSLSMLEADALRSVNFNIQKKFTVNPSGVTTKVSDELIRQHPERDAGPIYYSEIIESLRDKFSPVIDRYNDTYFGGQPVLRLFSDAAPVDTPAPREDFASVVNDVISALITVTRSIDFDGISLHSTIQQPALIVSTANSAEALSCNGWSLSDGRVERSQVNLKALQRRDQSAIDTLSPGWSPVSIWLVQDHLCILVLKNTENKRALWYFDADGQFIGNSAQTIWSHGPWVREAFSALFRRLLLECVAPGQHEPHLITEAIEPLSAEFSAFADDLFAGANDLTGDRTSSEGRLLNASPAEVQDEVLKGALGEMNLEWRGRQLRATRGIVVNDFVFAYPLFEGSSLSALILVGSHTGVRIAFFDLTRMDLCYRRVPGFANLTKHLTDLVGHLRIRWPLLRKYFETSGLVPTVGVTRSGHLGHRLWNEVSGLHRVQQSGGAQHLQALIHFDQHDVGEVWLGAREVLEKPGLNVVVAGPGKISVAQWVYENKMFPLRIGDSYIPKALADRLAIHCRSLTGGQVTAKSMGELRIVFGLRFENRTWLNQTEGLAELACYLAGRIPKLTIIIDGHDRILGRKAVSYGEQRTNGGLVEQEKGVVQAIGTALAAQRHGGSVRVVDAVDMELSSTMAWILSADCFVAPWGAGLTKYKWVANLDGVIFSNREVVEKKSDLKIYESPNVREGATECIYLPVQYVVEQPSASSPITVAGEGGIRENFVVDMAGLKATVDQLLARVLGSGE
ncbi:hypothetical protein MXC99_00935 [Thauera aromatica]|uniref:hypothetical protein n=1 Tax=Thauera aromatica TaxID=59405 RepID=UPI001FFC748E|nr:hypothetical protein [Thauera aromatica]MCK2086759.1 hypothetical protein [Thauera aromatica]